jgi:cyanophycinase
VRPRRALVACLLAASAALAGCAQIHKWLPILDRAPAQAQAPAPKARRTGTLLLSGGGHVPGAVVAEAARLTGGAGTSVLVVPLASAASDAEAGQGAADTWRKAGFANVEVLDARDAAHAASQMEAATFLWMTGGDPTRLVRRLIDAGLVENLRRRFEAGAVVGGTNEGAAVVSELMLTGTGEEDEMQQGRIDTAGGLGLWRGVILDHRFVAKKRFNRLMAAVIDHPQFVGVGIDESTGVVVTGSTMRVVGDGNVVVIDARRAKISPSRPGDASAATGVEMNVLSGGMTYELAR